MAELKFKSLPKRPKNWAKASLQTKINYLNKVNEAKKYNQRIIALAKVSENLDKKIANAIAGFKKRK